MNVIVIKYNAGNIMSVDYALQRLGINALITDDIELIQKADKVIFPGVGEASSAMKYLQNHKLDKVIKELKQPVLGICIGLQLLCSHSQEGNIDCIGVFPNKVKLFELTLKVPHMGWNTIESTTSGLFAPPLENQYVYFVHSYYAQMGEYTIATTDYTVKFSAALHKNNFYATQFHPEKSGIIGSKILTNFLNIK